MTKFNHDDVVGLDSINDVGEASLDGVRTRAAATDGLVDNRRTQ